MRLIFMREGGCLAETFGFNVVHTISDLLL